MARYEPCATAGRVPSLFLKAEHSSQGVGYAGLGISIERDRLQRRATGSFDFSRLVVARSTDDSCKIIVRLCRMLSSALQQSVP